MNNINIGYMQLKLIMGILALVCQQYGKYRKEEWFETRCYAKIQIEKFVVQFSLISDNFKLVFNLNLSSSQVS